MRPAHDIICNYRHTICKRENEISMIVACEQFVIQQRLLPDCEVETSHGSSRRDQELPVRLLEPVPKLSVKVLVSYFILKVLSCVMFSCTLPVSAPPTCTLCLFSSVFLYCFLSGFWTLPLPFGLASLNQTAYLVFPLTFRKSLCVWCPRVELTLSGVLGM